MERLYRIQADINIDNVRHNIMLMKKNLAPDTKLMAVIKADGYGHGSVELSKALDDLADYYAVAFIDEGIELREHGCKKPILILGYTDSCDFDRLMEYNITASVYDYEEAVKLDRAAAEAGRKAVVHLKVDTGMSRIGVSCDKKGLDTAIGILKLENIITEGIFTHYAKADEYDKTAANSQLEAFRWFINELCSCGYDIPLKHISNSAGIMEMDNTGFNMARAGITTYGLYPSEEVDRDVIKLYPAMELVSRIIHVKDVKKGTGIGYGWTYVASHDMKVATVSAGYADGYPRAMSGIGHVIIHGEYAPIVGRVCMDQLMVDVSHIDNVKTGDEVVLIGERGDKKITVEEVAKPAASFNYELVCNIGRRVPRVYYRSGKPYKTLNYLFSLTI